LKNLPIAAWCHAAEMFEFDARIALIATSVSSFHANGVRVKIRREALWIRFKEDNLCEASGNDLLCTQVARECGANSVPPKTEMPCLAAPANADISACTTRPYSNASMNCES